MFTKIIMQRLNCIKILLFIIVLSGIIQAGTTGKIAGTVKDALTGEPLIGVNILIVGTNYGAAADMDGNYYIINIPPGIYDMKASMMGFTSKLLV